MRKVSAAMSSATPVPRRRATYRWISLKYRSKISAKASGESRERAAAGARSSSGGVFVAGGDCALKLFQAVVT